MKLIFYIRYHTSFGERLAIAANAAELQLQGAYAEMQYLNDEYWKLETEVDISGLPGQVLTYRYILIDREGAQVEEHHQCRSLYLGVEETPGLKLYDTWNFAGAVANTFYTAPFQKVLLHRRKASKPVHT